MAVGGEGKRAALEVPPAKTCCPMDGVDTFDCTMGDGDGE